MKFKLVLSVVLSISFLFCWDVRAGDVENKTKELSGLKVKINRVTQAVKDLKKQRKSLLAELRKIEVKYGKSISELSQLGQQIDVLKKTLEKNKRQRLLKQKIVDSHKQGLANQVKAAYGMGKNEKLKVTLNQQDPALSGRVMVYYDYLNKTRLRKIAAVEKNLQVLYELEVQIAKETSLLEKKLAKKKQAKIALLDAKKGRKAILTKISKQFKSKNQQLIQYKESKKKLAALILSLQQPMADFPFDEGAVKEFVKLKGSLPWPVKGVIEKKFGERRSDSRWDGVLIDAKEGHKVRAVTRGQVVYADWLRGYGLLTIIKHDNGYMTLYAFNQSLYKAKGDWVEAGTVISTVGLSDGRSRSGLYFGIRKKGKPVNPVKWCRKIRHGKVG